MKINAANKIYVNLTKSTFSVQEKAGSNWKVINHTDNCIITDFSTRVSEATRLRIVKEKKKYVHAFILGTVQYVAPKVAKVIGSVSYNPYKEGHFTLKFEGAANKVKLDDWVDKHGTEGYALVADYSRPYPIVKLVRAYW